MEVYGFSVINLRRNPPFVVVRVLCSKLIWMLGVSINGGSKFSEEAFQAVFTGKKKTRNENNLISAPYSIISATVFTFFFCLDSVSELLSV